jgi:hypothetical protein
VKEFFASGLELVEGLERPCGGGYAHIWPAYLFMNDPVLSLFVQYVHNSAPSLASNEKPAIMIHGVAEGLSGDSDPLSIFLSAIQTKLRMAFS